MDVRLYTSNKCVFCDRLVELFKHYDVPYTQYNIEDPTNLQVLYSYDSNITTVPQVFIDNIHIGGFEETKEWIMKKVENKEL